ncbi:unnamed protein product [marine sediment metagenome]|uniref:Uncharacterized protein n=1 Tax=marine sediment metagenome TaxID=412755 RepID=X1QD66_9ZZZZ
MLENINFHFDYSLLSPLMFDALEDVIMEFQATGISEDVVFDVFPVKFPEKFRIRVPWCDSFVLWNPIESRYSEIPGAQFRR